MNINYYLTINKYNNFKIYIKILNKLWIIIYH